MPCPSIFACIIRASIYRNAMLYSVPPTLRDQLMQRVMIIGSPGSGKTTLAWQLGTILGIEVVHLDRYFWQPGWVEPPRDEWIKTQQRLIQRPQWIMDGNYGATQDIRLAVADTIIFLDRSRWLCLWRAIKRRVQYHGRSRPDLPPDCPERLDWAFVKYVWSYPRTRRPKIMQRIAKYRVNKRVVVLEHGDEVRKFLTAMQREHSHSAPFLQPVDQR